MRVPNLCSTSPYTFTIRKTRVIITVVTRRPVGLLLIVILLVALGTADTLSASPWVSVVFADDFDDGDITENPTWTEDRHNYHNGGVTDGAMHMNGSSDNSDRYRSVLFTYPIFAAPDYLEFSFRGFLKPSGQPQAGRQIEAIVQGSSSPAPHSYILSMGDQRGGTNFRFKLRYEAPGPDIIVADIRPVRGDWYHVRAVRQSGIWSLYVDDVLIASEPDPLSPVTEFDFLAVAAVGSVIVDDIEIRIGRTVREVAIDVKPGSDPNCFNSDGHGVIPVAVLSSSEFDATLVDPLTVQLDGQAVRIVGKGNNQAHVEDVDGDGLDDLVVQIEDIDGTYAAGDAEATLNGTLYDGRQITGVDSICIVP